MSCQYDYQLHKVPHPCKSDLCLWLDGRIKNTIAKFIGKHDLWGRIKTSLISKRAHKQVLRPCEIKAPESHGAVYKNLGAVWVLLVDWNTSLLLFLFWRGRGSECHSLFKTLPWLERCSNNRRTRFLLLSVLQIKKL